MFVKLPIHWQDYCEQLLAGSDSNTPATASVTPSNAYADSANQNSIVTTASPTGANNQAAAQLLQRRFQPDISAPFDLDPNATFGPHGETGSLARATTTLNAAVATKVDSQARSAWEADVLSTVSHRTVALVTRTSLGRSPAATLAADRSPRDPLSPTATAPTREGDPLPAGAPSLVAEADDRCQTGFKSESGILTFNERLAS